MARGRQTAKTTGAIFSSNQTKPNQTKPMHIIKPKTARVLRMTAAMRSLRRGDAIVMDRKPKGWNNVHAVAGQVG